MTEYYKIRSIGIYRIDGENKSIGDANGQYVPNGKTYFDRMGEGEIIKDAPIFDYFHLQSYGEEKDWEWRLQDVHGFISVGSIIIGWYISNDLKLLLENFKIAPKYHFYETRLLYQGKKLIYWIFQFPIDPLLNIDFIKSQFFYLKENKKVEVSITSSEDFLLKRRELALKHDFDLESSLLYIKNNYDVVYVLPSGDTIVSKPLKQAIEEMNITGFEFSELDYEVVVDSGLKGLFEDVMC